MDATEVGEFIGMHLIGIFVLILTIYPIYKTIKRKQWNWLIVLIINILTGLVFPIYLSMIIPLLYLYWFRKSK